MFFPVSLLTLFQQSKQVLGAFVRKNSKTSLKKPSIGCSRRYWHQARQALGKFQFDSLILFACDINCDNLKLLPILLWPRMVEVISSMMSPLHLQGCHCIWWGECITQSNPVSSWVHEFVSPFSKCRAFNLKMHDSSGKRRHLDVLSIFKQFPDLPWQRQIFKEQGLQDLVGRHVCLVRRPKTNTPPNDKWWSAKKRWYLRRLQSPAVAYPSSWRQRIEDNLGAQVSLKSSWIWLEIDSTDSMSHSANIAPSSQHCQGIWNHSFPPKNTERYLRSKNCITFSLTCRFSGRDTPSEFSLIKGLLWSTKNPHFMRLEANTTKFNKTSFFPATWSTCYKEKVESHWAPNNCGRCKVVAPTAGLSTARRSDMVLEGDSGIGEAK